ncbi:MAG TPA: energy transducer TonB [Candidatus Sulfotelmatobacter sp.]|jgi:TonB family protein
MSDRLLRSSRTLSGLKSALVTLALFSCSMLFFVPRLLAQDAGAPKPHRKIVIRVEPEYPYVLRNGHFEGQVRLEATVLPNGSVSKVEAKGGNPMLSQYAAEAVMRWKYAPGPAQTLEETVFVFHPNQQ